MQSSETIYTETRSMGGLMGRAAHCEVFVCQPSGRAYPTVGPRWYHESQQETSERAPLLPSASSSGREPPSVLPLEGETHETPGTPQLTRYCRSTPRNESNACLPIRFLVSRFRIVRDRDVAPVFEHRRGNLASTPPVSRRSRFISFFRLVAFFFSFSLCPFVFLFIFSLHLFCAILLGLHVYLELLYLGLRATTSLESGC